MFGRLTVYEPRGDYQLLLEAVEPKGIGALQLAFMQLKSKLEERRDYLKILENSPLPAFPGTDWSRDVPCWCRTS